MSGAFGDGESELTRGVGHTAVQSLKQWSLQSRAVANGIMPPRILRRSLRRAVARLGRRAVPAMGDCCHLKVSGTIRVLESK